MTTSTRPFLRLTLALAIASSALITTDFAHAGKKRNNAGFRLVIKPFFHHHHRSSEHRSTKETDPCPQDFECGHRVYADQTGPRIIQVGSPDRGELDYSGPRIIRLKD